MNKLDNEWKRAGMTFPPGIQPGLVQLMRSGYAMGAMMAINLLKDALPAIEATEGKAVSAQLKSVMMRIGVEAQQIQEEADSKARALKK